LYNLGEEQLFYYLIIKLMNRKKKVNYLNFISEKILSFLKIYLSSL